MEQGDWLQARNWKKLVADMVAVWNIGVKFKLPWWKKIEDYAYLPGKALITEVDEATHGGGDNRKFSYRWVRGEETVGLISNERAITVKWKRIEEK